jgi:hypothetical protein
MAKEIFIRGGLIIVGLLVLAVLSMVLRRIMSRTIHKESIFYAFLFPGTVFHELCHFTACLVTLTPVYEVHLFRLMQEEDGTAQLGEVVHGDMGPIRNMFIGVAPLTGSAVMLYFLSVWFIPKGFSPSDILTSGWTYLFILLAFFIVLGMSPSKQDMKGLPVFVVTIAGLGAIGYYVWRWVNDNPDITKFQEAILNTLKTVNSGLLIVVVTVGIITVLSFLFTTVFKKVIRL